MKQYVSIDGTVYFWFAGNDTSGSGGDGASPAADVRLAGAAADAAPVYSPTPVLLSNAGYPAGAYEVAIAATAGNGFAADNTYAVFCTLAIDSQNPTGFVGSFDTMPVQANAIEIEGADPTDTIRDAVVDDATRIDASALNTLSGHDPGANLTKAGDLMGLAADAITAAKIADNAIAGEHLNATACTKIIDDFETQSQADPTGFHVNVKEVNGTAQTANDVGGDVNTILADTNELQTDWVNGGRLDLILDIIAHDTTTDIPGTITTMQGNITDILGDTNELQGDWANAGRLDTLLDACALEATVAALNNISAANVETACDASLVTMFTSAAELVDNIWDELLTGATHNIASSAGRRVREIGAYAIHSGTAQAGDGIHITLAATASATTGIYNRNLIVIVGGTGAGQTRTIVDYAGATKVLLADREWRVNPDNTSEYQIVPDDTPLVADHGLARAGSANTIQLRTYASDVDNAYKGEIIAIIAGTGRGESAIVESYVGATRVATACENWNVAPDTTSVYVMMPYGKAAVACIGASALADIKTQADDALTDYGFNDITVADIIAGIADGSYDFQEMIRIMFAAISGKSAGGGTATLTFRDAADGKNRISETVDGNGNRTAVTRDGT